MAIVMVRRDGDGDIDGDEGALQNMRAPEPWAREKPKPQTPKPVLVI
jgi:hypothetical protein